MNGECKTGNGHTGNAYIWFRWRTGVDPNPVIQNISLNFRNVLYSDLPWAGSFCQPLTQQDIRNVFLANLIVILLNHQIMTKERVIYWFR